MLVQFSQVGIFLTLAFGGFCFALIGLDYRFSRKTKFWLNVCSAILIVSALVFSKAVTDGNLTLVYLLGLLPGIVASGVAIARIALILFSHQFLDKGR